MPITPTHRCYFSPIGGADLAQEMIELGVRREKRLQRHVVHIAQVILDAVMLLQTAERRPVVGEVLSAQLHRLFRPEAEQVLDVFGDARVDALHEPRRGGIERVVEIEEDGEDWHGLIC